MSVPMPAVTCPNSGFKKSLAEALAVLGASRIGRQLLQSCN